MVTCRSVVVYNPLTIERDEIIRLRVSSIHVRIHGEAGKYLPCQVNPIFSRNEQTLFTEEYEVSIQWYA